MVSTRSSQDSPSKTGEKRAAESSSSPPAKRGKTVKAAEKDQKTIEETMKGVETVEEDQDIKKQISGDVDTKDEKSEAVSKENGHTKKETHNEAEKKANNMEGKTGHEVAGNTNYADSKPNESKPTPNGGAKESRENGSSAQKAENNSEDQDSEKNAFDEIKSDVGEVKKAAKDDEKNMEAAIADSSESVLEDAEREKAMPSSILEKGIIYFFFRGRVGVEEPQGVDDIARSYIVLRPLPIGAKIGEGPIEDSGNARLLALPKKVLPKSQSDRFLMFVEKVKSTVKDLKENFIAGSEYATKTAGTSHRPAATPIAEGIYAITSTGRESHLAYHITAPELGEVQKDLGINEKGSYVLSVKNPTASGPANATLDKGAEYSKELMEKFRGLRWTPLEPEHLEYENTQFLIIGEGMGDTGKATALQEKDEKHDKEEPEKELEKLEEEDTRRVEHLKGDDAVFADLGLSSKEYPKTQTTW